MSPDPHTLPSRAKKKKKEEEGGRNSIPRDDLAISRKFIPQHSYKMATNGSLKQRIVHLLPIVRKKLPVGPTK